MEQCLLDALSQDKATREASNSFLQSSEKLPGFSIKMIEIFSNSNAQLQVLSLISLKNCIYKYWPNSQRIPNDDKTQIKNFLVTHIESQEFISKFITESIVSINKFEYLDTWPELGEYLVKFNNSEKYLKLLHSVIKAQLRKGSARCRNNLKDLLNFVFNCLYSSWTVSENLYLDKIIMKSLLIQFDSFICSQVISRASSYYSDPEKLKHGKIVTKGLNSLILKNNEAFSRNIKECVGLFIKTTQQFKGTSLLNKEILDFTFQGLRDILVKFDERDLIDPFAESLLEKTLETELDERWESWNQGDYQFFLQNTEEVETDSVRKFQETLLQQYPRLLSKVTSLINSNLTFMQAHTVCNLYGILSKFPGSSDQDFQFIVSKFSQIPAQGIEKLVLYRDLLILSKKWLSIIKDLNFVYQLLVTIKASTNDWIVLYECCLVLKQITYNKLPTENLVNIVNEFGLVAFELISQVQTPSCVWHLTTFISNLIEASDSNLVFIKALKDFGLQKLIVDENEMTVQSVGDMLEKLMEKNKGNKEINEAFSANLQARLNRKDKEAVQHWLTFLNYFQGDLAYIEALLPYFPLISHKKREIQIKIAEEYLLIFYEQGATNKAAEFFMSFLQNLRFFTNNYEEDYLSLELLFCIYGVIPPKSFELVPDLLNYMSLSSNDTYELLCIQNCVLVFSRFLLNSIDFIGQFNLTPYLDSLSLLTHHNHLTFVCSALKRILVYLPASVQSDSKILKVLSYESSEIVNENSMPCSQSKRFLLLFHN